MFSGKKEEDNKELNLCKENASILDKISFHKCKTTPDQFKFDLQPIHWEVGRFDGSITYGSYAGIPAAGVYEAKGTGMLFKPLYSEDECRKATDKAANEWVRCASLLPEPSVKPKP